VAGSSGGRRVLVVDDIDEMRTLIHRALSASGYQVDVASTLAQAREMDPGGYDAVLVDAGLGPERGIDLVEALRAEDPAAAGRCLVITGGAADAIPDGIAWLTKPFQLADLLAAVQALHRPTAVTTADPVTGIGPDDGVNPPLPVMSDGRLPAAAPQAWQLLSLVRRLRTRERHELIDFLHDGPIQDLTAVTLDLQLMARSTAPCPAPRFEATLRQLDSAAGSLRWLVDGRWPFLVPATRLADALQQRTAWLLGAPMTVHADVRAAGLTVTETAVIADVVELMLLGMLPAGPPLHADVAVRSEENQIQIELILTAGDRDELPARDPATTRAALGELASALEATAHADLGDRRWQARIVLPRQAKTIAHKSMP
jgi:CheY-like chemotaxis protein